MDFAPSPGLGLDSRRPLCVAACSANSGLAARFWRAGFSNQLALYGVSAPLVCHPRRGLGRWRLGVAAVRDVVQLGWRRSGLLKAIGWGVLGFVLLYLNVIVWAVFKGATAQPALLAPSPWRLALVVFFAFGIAAWVEENLYRGYLQPLLVGRFGLPVAVVVQAALFALAHLGYYRQALDFGMAFVAGLILGWLRKRDGSLVAPYVAHGLFWLMAAFMAVAA